MRRQMLEPTSLTQVPHSSRSSNAVDVFLDVAWQVKVDDVLNVGDVQTTSSDLRKAKKDKTKRNASHGAQIYAGGKKLAKRSAV